MRCLSTAFCASSQATKAFASDTCVVALSVRAKLKAEIEVYKGANHGWMPPDSQAYNADAAERGWARKLELFKKALA